MVYQRLWIVNSAIVVIALITGVAQVFLWKPVTTIGRLSHGRVTTIEEMPVSVVVQPESIFKNDLFNTYREPEAPQAVKKNIQVPLPVMPAKKTVSAPAPAAPTFLPQLPITLKGLIRSSSQSDTVALIADQTGREKTYRVGDQVQDATILKIARNKVIFLRSNGQQETFFLRKPEKVTGKGKDHWPKVIQKSGPRSFTIDPHEFSIEFTSLGEVIELFHLGSAYVGSTIVGVRIGNCNGDDISSQFGLELNDIITNVSVSPAPGSSGIGSGEIETKDREKRMQLYNLLATATYGQTITLTVRRQKDTFKINYTLQKWTPPQEEKRSLAPQASQQILSTSAANDRNIVQEKRHTPDQQAEVNKELRQRMLANLEQRSLTRRIPS